MNGFAKKLIATTFLFGVIFSIIVSCVTLALVPSFSIYWLVGTCLFFLLLETGIILYIINTTKDKKKDKKLVNAYLLTKVVKIFLSLFIIAFYLLQVRTEVKTYLVLFAVLYFCYLILESILFVKIEKRLKEEIHEK